MVLKTLHFLEFELLFMVLVKEATAHQLGVNIWKVLGQFGVEFHIHVYLPDTHIFRVVDQIIPYGQSHT